MRPTKRTTAAAAAAASETAKKEAVKLLISMAAEKTADGRVVAPAVDANVVVLPVAASSPPALPAAAPNEDHIIEDDDDDDEEESTEKCRVCTISSSCFSYYNIFERMIFKNVAMADALAMITSLDIRPDDQLPPTICCRCEQRLLDAYHFRKLASSSARTFQRTLGIAVNGKAPSASKALSSITTNAVKREAANNSRNTDAQFEQFAREQLAVAANFAEDNDDEDDAAANTLVDIIAAEPNADDATGMEYTDEHGEAANVELEVGEQVDSFKIVYDADGGNDEDDDAVTFLINYASEGSNDKRTLSAKQSPTVVESIAVSSKPKKQSAATSAAAAAATPATRTKSQRQVINVRTPAADSAEYLKRKHKCEVCDKRFIGRSNLVDHLRQHANVRPYQCDHCDKAFVQKGSLICHMRTHTLERPFACNVCDKTFSQASSRQIHMRIHTQERCYVCPTCEKGFFSNSDLCKHKRTHDAVMAYACPHCTAGFAQRSNLKKHMMRKHPKEVAAAAAAAEQ